jgi:hypothetical protein
MDGAPVSRNNPIELHAFVGMVGATQGGVKLRPDAMCGGHLLKAAPFSKEINRPDLNSSAVCNTSHYGAAAFTYSTTSSFTAYKG